MMYLVATYYNYYDSNTLLLLYYRLTNSTWIVTFCCTYVLYIDYLYNDISYAIIIFKFTDINECRVNNGNCRQNCYNTPGSYYCSCDTGYQLHSDRRKCIGNNSTCCKLYMYACMYVGLYVFTYVCMYVCIYLHIVCTC